jgi:hypothetical protein
VKPREGEFSNRSKEILAGRAGHRCSFPTCRRGTTGPGPGLAEVSNIGVAAHIYGASEGGPRGAGGLSATERSKPENGIWLCEEHARLVDNNRGERYPAELLLRYRYLHENRIAMEQGHRPFGLLERIVVEENHHFVEGSELQLGKVTLIAGKNASGKSFLSKIINTLSHEERHQLEKIFLRGKRLTFSVHLLNPGPRILRVSGLREQFDVTLDGRAVQLNPLAVDVYFQEKKVCRERLESYLSRKRKECKDSNDPLDDLDLLSEYWQMGPDLVRKLVARAGTFVFHSFDNARFEESGGVFRLLVNDPKWRPDASIHQLSGSMLEMLSLDVMIARAIDTAEHAPTVLLLDDPLLGFDCNNMELYVSFLASDEVKFQTIITSPCSRWLDSDLLWGKVQLDSAGSRACIRQC